MKGTNKGTLLWVPFQETSAFNACFPLVRACVEAGYSCVFVVFDKFASHIKERGFRVAEIEVAEIEAATAELKGRERLHVLDDYVSARFKQILEQERPAFAFLDQMLWWRASLLVEAGIPFMMLSNTYAGPWTFSRPPVFSNSKLAGGSLARLSYFMQWVRLALFPSSRCNNEPLPGLLLSSWFRSKRTDAMKAGLNVGWGEYGYRISKPELVLGPALLDWDVPGETRRYAGACLDLERRGRDRLVGDNVDELLQELDEPPLVYVSFGSYRFFKGRRAVYRELLRFMASRQDLQMVLQIRDDECDGLDFPDNVTTMDWAPQLDILSQASLFVTHGGLSSVKEGLVRGVPLLVIPFYNDGFGNGARVEALSVGRVLQRRAVNQESLSQAFDALMTSETLATKIAKVKEQLIQELDCQTGLAVIQEALRSKS